MMMITMEIHGVTVQRTIPKWILQTFIQFPGEFQKVKSIVSRVFADIHLYDYVSPWWGKNREETLTIHIYWPHHHQLHTFYLLALIQYTLGVLVKRRKYFILAPLHQHKMGI